MGVAQLSPRLSIHSLTCCAPPCSFGYYDIGFRNPLIKTPTMDAMVKTEAALLTRHYTFKYCSPTRRSFLVRCVGTACVRDRGCSEPLTHCHVREVAPCNTAYVRGLHQHCRVSTVACTSELFPHLAHIRKCNRDTCCRPLSSSLVGTVWIT